LCSTRVFSYHNSLCAFVLALLGAGFFTAGDVARLCRSILTHVSIYNDAGCAILSWFAPELEAADAALFFHGLRAFRGHLKCTAAPSLYRPIYDGLDDLRRDNWRRLRERRRPLSLDPVYDAIRMDDVDVLQSEIGGDLDFSFDLNPFETSWVLVQQRMTPIQLAAYFGALRCFKYLLLNHARVGATNGSLSLAQFAIAGGNTEIIRLVEQQDCVFTDSLHCAALFHQNNVFEWLLATGQVFREDSESHTVEFVGMMAENLEVLAACMDAGINLAAADPSHMTLLHYAAQFGNELAARFLLARTHVDVNARSNGGLAPLHIAVKAGHVGIVRALLGHKDIDVNVRTPDGVCPLHFAVLKGSREGVATILASPAVSVHVVDRIGRTPLSIAVKLEMEDVQRMLWKVHHVVLLTALPRCNDAPPEQKKPVKHRPVTAVPMVSRKLFAKSPGNMPMKVTFSCDKAKVKKPVGARPRTAAPPKKLAPLEVSPAEKGMKWLL
jgi:ankyrin repeat protein